MATCVEDGIFELKEAKAILEDITNKDLKNIPTSLIEMFKVFGDLKAKCPTILTDKAIYENGVLTWIEQQIANPKSFGIHIAEDIIKNRGDIVDKAKNTEV